jgi:integrase
MYKRTPLEKRLRLRGKVYSFWGYDYAGKRYTASTHQTDPKAALSAARRIEREKSVPPPDQATNPATQEATLAQALSLLSKHDARVGAAHNTVEFHEGRGRHLVRLLLADTRLIDITQATLQAYSDKRLAEHADRHTIQKEHRVLRHAARLAKAVNAYSGDPKALTVEGFDVPSGKRGFYKPGVTWLQRMEWIEELIAQTSANPDKHRVDRRDDLLTIINMGLRRRELLVICPEHVDLRKRILYLRELEKDGAVERELKTDESTRELPLNDIMHALFGRRMRRARLGVPLFTDWGSGNRDLQANWRRARAALLARAKSRRARQDLDAILPKSLTFNDLRRTFCSLMKNAGVSLDDCAELLGHKDTAMVRLVYGHTTLDRLRAAVAQLPGMALPLTPIGRTQKLSRRHRQRLHAQAREAAEKCPSTLGADTVSDTNPMPESGFGGAG